jgi:heptose-I-phosphate ethanolaminephosphotransferase
MKFITAIKHYLYRTNVLSILGGVLFSWAIQCTSKINLENTSLLRVVQENFWRIISSGILGGLLFFGIYRLAHRIKNQKVKTLITHTLPLFNVYVFYLYLEGKDIAFFNHLLILIGFAVLLKWYKDSFGLAILQSKNNVSFLYATFILSYFSFCSHLFTDELSFFNAIQTLSSYAIFAIPILLLPKWQRIYLFLATLVVFIYMLPELYHIYMFGTKMPISVYYVMLDAPSSEKWEYLSSYFTWDIIGLVVPFISIPLCAIFFLPKTKDKNHTHEGTLLLIVLALFLFVDKDNYKNGVFYPYIKSAQDYSSKIEKLQSEIQFRKKHKKEFAKLKDYNPVKKGKTFVLIIGESTGKRHMQLYNYFRKTNPKLTSIQKELFVFKDVISPHSHTLPVLEKVLTFANFEDMDPLYKEGSVIELFKQADYKTYWLSNQFFFDEYGSFVTQVGKESDYYLFINDDENVDETKSYDEKLLKTLEIILNKKDENKLIVLHLMGTHGNYVNRYPESFDYFKWEDSKDIPTRNKQFLQDGDYGKFIINQYDNAVRYNDQVIFDIIQKVKQTSAYSNVLYFSDHGEEVFDSRNYFSHQETDATSFMFDIPMLVWLSDGYKKHNPKKTKEIQKSLKRKYQTDDIIHTILDLSNIQIQRWEPKKSVINPGFKPEKRWMNNKDYEIEKKKFKQYNDVIYRKNDK